MLPTPRKPEKPVFWIIAGPNGCGKSTSYNRTDIEGWGGSVWIINPDLLTVRLVEQERLALADANKQALDRIKAWLEASILVHQTIGVETVLSSFKYRKLLRKAQDLGFEVRLIYVLLESVDLQLERIRQRVEAGGHDVPAAKVPLRRRRSFEQFAWFCRKADTVVVFDNTTGTTKLVATKERGGQLVKHHTLPSDLNAILVRRRVPTT